MKDSFVTKFTSTFLVALSITRFSELVTVPIFDAEILKNRDAR